MTGTSMDGVDVCLARIDLSIAELEFEILDNQTIPFEPEMREAIRRALAGNPDDVGALHFRLGQTYAQAATEFLQGRPIDVIGCHGQTLAHQDGNYTLQVGTTVYLSQSLKAPVVSSFREGDVAAGGSGAPLMPFLDWLLCRSRSTPTIVLNIGGVANISAVKPEVNQRDVVGFDTGPGMALIDEASRLMFDQPMDHDGHLSSGGMIHEEILSNLMSHPFILRHPPKSTGRDEFGMDLVQQLANQYTIPATDLLRTLVRFTARSIAENIRRFVDFEADTLIASGGGIHHRLLMADLNDELPGWEVSTSQVLGIDPDFKEAFMIAVLAAAHIRRIPGNMPGVTGASDLVVLGNITPK
jgi:anhydro-N-acetylmuramic acid kinase